MEQYPSCHKVEESRYHIITHVNIMRADGSAKQCDTKKTVEKAVQGKIKPQFLRANSAPVC